MTEITNPERIRLMKMLEREALAIANTEHVKQTIDRIISNAPRICEHLCEHGHYNIALQLEHDVKNLKYWRERGGLTTVKNEWEE